MARRTKRSDQQNLPADGMSGDNPELDKLCREALDLEDSEVEAHRLTEAKRDEIKRLMQEVGKDNTHVEGRTFKLKPTLQLTVTGRRSRGGNE
jgi:hypothetical protein